ncbi:MAG: dihydroorotase [Candidatus Tectomicrobia bacterium]|uniref:Dihydroorotase n=1 Tax=Tectimicrobiota bacterium TaxID=2528274 RepID=A0A932GPL9_UNCTE|nr:dihydroorotase [Candidatus Tectomicrobia bacterium]
MEKLLIRGGHVLDPSRGIDAEMDLLIEKGRIAALGPPGTLLAEEILAAHGRCVVPGFVDMHTHLREPGFDYKETIRTGTAAAAAGGFTSVACMANTQPVNDNRTVTEYILEKARLEGSANVYPIGAVSKGLGGEELAEIGEMAEAGIVGISDDGQPVRDSHLMRRALEYASMFGLPVISHCEDKTICPGGVMNESFVSTELGLNPIPNACEEIMVARDILLAELTRGRLHIAHVSTAGSVHLIRDAKRRGVPVTCEVTPHHLFLTDEAVRSFDTTTKVNPPLRTAADGAALREGLRDGTIDAIATDHAPHEQAAKELDFSMAPFGLIGLETAFPLCLRLVKEGVLTLSQLIAKMTVEPARILSIPKGSLAVGSDADLAILDLEKRYVIDVRNFRSRSRNCPFDGWEVQGKAVCTLRAGEIVYEAENLRERSARTSWSYDNLPRKIVY